MPDPLIRVEQDQRRAVVATTGDCAIDEAAAHAKAIDLPGDPDHVRLVVEFGATDNRDPELPTPEE